MVVPFLQSSSFDWRGLSGVTLDETRIHGLLSARDTKPFSMLDSSRIDGGRVAKKNSFLRRRLLRKAENLCLSFDDSQVDEVRVYGT